MTMGKLVSIWLIEFIVNIYDLLTLPIYYVLQQPWRVKQEALRKRAVQVSESTWRSLDSALARYENCDNIATLDQLFRDSVDSHPDRDCLGTRKILSVEYREPKGSDQVDPSKTHRQVSKYILDDKYTWLSFKQVETAVIKLSTGLIDICGESVVNLDGQRKILICADTSMQWFLMAHACFRNNITVVTAYTTLDDDAILDTLAQTEVKIIVSSQSFSRRLPKILANANHVDTIVLLDEPLPGEQDQKVLLKQSLPGDQIKRVTSTVDLMTRGESLKENITSVPTKSDVAVLMFTSGSTGRPKGVMLTHENIVFTALSFPGPGEITENDRHIAYLPLGHVFELAGECIFLSHGCKIGYSSPQTLTSSSPLIKKGQVGDINLIKPTIMGSVPLVLDRVRIALQQAIKSQGCFYDQLLNDFVIRYKRYWWARYYETPLMNYIICRKFKNILGGHLKIICSGGAALSRETQEYIRHLTSVDVIQGYGLTETTAAASYGDALDRRYNIAGAPYPTALMRLESWSDYSVDDKPYPRGEVLIGGLQVAAGYYKMPEVTAENFFVDPKTGTRFFRTGDVGLMLPDGVLKIIDRKKDIVKPLSGEYICLGAIETALVTAPIVENICTYCSQHSNYVVAIVRPNEPELRSLAVNLYNDDDASNKLAMEFRSNVAELYGRECGRRPDQSVAAEAIIESISFEPLCSNKQLVAKVLEIVQKAGERAKLKRTQIPSRIKLAHEEWTVESGLLTSSFKLRRREIERLYQPDIKQMYLDLGQNIEQT